MRIKVSFVLQFIDDFTDKIITDKILTLKTLDGKTPIIKNDGYYVFLNCQDTNEVIITSSYYMQKTVKIKNGDTLKVRLYPNIYYKFSNNHTYLTGKAEKNTEIKATLKKSNFRLLYDYNNLDDKKISIFNPLNIELVGRYFLIWNKDNEEFIQIKENYNNIYLLSSALKNDYKKVGTKLYEVYYTIANENGEYILPIKEKFDENCECIIYTQKEIKTLNIKFNQNNIIDFI